MIQPHDVGAPEHLSTWRPVQAELFAGMLEARKRIVVIEAPVGVGKSLLLWTYGRLMTQMGSRALLMTMTNGLMDQYAQDFPGLEQVRGMRHYPCRALADMERCDAGPCLDGENCLWRNSGCSFFDRAQAAAWAPMAMTNYDYLLSGQPARLGHRDVVLCDEAHDLADKVCGSVGVGFSEREMAVPEFQTLAEWRDWAGVGVSETKVKLDEAHTPRRGRELRNLLQRYERLRGADGSWAWERTKGGFRAEPVTAEGHVDRVWGQAERIILASATLPEAELERLGLGPRDYDYLTCASPFAPEIRPIYSLYCGIAVTGRTEPRKLAAWRDTVDQVIGSRLSGRGIIHTVSYDRARYLQQNSRYAAHMVLHDSRGTRDAVTRFRNTPPPVVLVSPSVHTGWDFPYDAARWQIVCKVPFPDCRSGIAAARQARDQAFAVKSAALTLQQMAGRVVRSEDDCGETIIVDDSMRNWFYRENAHRFSRWFREAYREVSALPAPRWA